MTTATVYKSGNYWLVDVEHSKIKYTDWGPSNSGFANEEEATAFAQKMSTI